ncbi:SDR family oxidoreductase [Candidatus Bathyarchaeota archaeon]|nr:SDR family oxidoreductase [Candidatus Bathyarchaeota archaeon]
MKERNVAIVAGSTNGGAGRSIALALAREGFNIVINNRKDEKAASEVAHSVQKYGVEALIVHADITNPQQVEALVKETVNKFGRVDILVINPGGEWKPCDLVETDIESVRETLDAETISVFICCKYVLPVMRKQKSGRIILISMENTDLPNVPSWAPYDYILGKSTRTYLARVIGEREKEHGITVNAICPTAFPHIAEEEAVAMNEHHKAWINRRKTMPQDIAEAVVYLTSEAGRFVTCSILQIREVKQTQ